MIYNSHCRNSRSPETESLLRPDHPDVGTSLNNLAVLYRTQGHYPLAEPLYISRYESLKASLTKKYGKPTRSPGCSLL